MFFYTYPFMVNGLSVLLFGEKMNRGQLVSLAAAFIGIFHNIFIYYDIIRTGKYRKENRQPCQSHFEKPHKLKRQGQ